MYWFIKVLYRCIFVNIHSLYVQHWCVDKYCKSDLCHNDVSK